jgi:hypothetical protein
MRGLRIGLAWALWDDDAIGGVSNKRLELQARCLNELLVKESKWLAQIVSKNSRT